MLSGSLLQQYKWDQCAMLLHAGAVLLGLLMEEGGGMLMGSGNVS